MKRKQKLRQRYAPTEEAPYIFADRVTAAGGSNGPPKAGT